MAEHIPWFCHRPSHPQKFIQTSPDTARIPRDINILEGGANRREKGPEPWNCCGCAEHQLQNPKRIHRPMGAQVCSAPLKGKICPAPMEVHHMASLCLQILSTFKQWVALEGLFALRAPCVHSRATFSSFSWKMSPNGTPAKGSPYAIRCMHISRPHSECANLVGFGIFPRFSELSVQCTKYMLPLGLGVKPLWGALCNPKIDLQKKRPLRRTESGIPCGCMQAAANRLYEASFRMPGHPHPICNLVARSFAHQRLLW